MTTREKHSNALQVESHLLPVLARLDGVPGSGETRTAETPVREFDQQRADSMLAHIAWSRLAEPGDGTAGLLLAVLGAEAALAALIEGIAAKEMCRLVQGAGYELAPRTAEEALGRWLPRLNRAETVADIERAATSNMRLVFPGDALWPHSLEDLGHHRPTMLWVKGDAKYLASMSLGVVGARAATGYGSHVTSEIVDGVSAAGVTIVSGAAYGIDAVAHRTALAAEVPTIAVLAGGADRPYPQAHSSLLERISTVGAVCSEMIPGSAPTRWRFLMRNRIIAALSKATLVTEAGLRSGSLNTANHAAGLGRPVGAVPGPVTSAASAGCHKLMREYGATLVTCASDALELLGLHDELAIFGDDSVERDGAWERKVLDAIPLRGERDLPSIARRAGLTPEQTRGVLAELELLGRVQRRESPGGSPPAWALLRRQ